MANITTKKPGSQVAKATGFLDTLKKYYKEYQDCDRKKLQLAIKGGKVFNQLIALKEKGLSTQDYVNALGMNLRTANNWRMVARHESKLKEYAGTQGRLISDLTLNEGLDFCRTLDPKKPRGKSKSKGSKTQTVASVLRVVANDGSSKDVAAKQVEAKVSDVKEVKLIEGPKDVKDPDAQEYCITLTVRATVAHSGSVADIKTNIADGNLYLEGWLRDEGGKHVLQNCEITCDDLQGFDE